MEKIKLNFDVAEYKKDYNEYMLSKYEVAKVGLFLTYLFAHFRNPMYKSNRVVLIVRQIFSLIFMV